MANLGDAWSILECPVCLETMKPPTRIWQCSMGHLLCEGCKNSGNVESCPMCRGPIIGRANAMEKMAQELYSKVDWDSDTEDDALFSTPRGSANEESSTTPSTWRASTRLPTTSETNTSAGTDVQAAKYIKITLNYDGRYIWLNPMPSYSCTVTNPRREQRFKGLQSVILYTLTPSFNNIEVMRGYKDFAWIYQKFGAKFKFLPLPPLPENKVQGRSVDDFMETQMNQLQCFVDGICRHPVLCQSEAWLHFLTCTDKNMWKSGKRKIEKDLLVGDAYLMALQTPREQHIDATKYFKPNLNVMGVESLEREVDLFSQFIVMFDGAVKNMVKVAATQSTKFENQYGKNCQLAAKAFIQLGKTVTMDRENSDEARSPISRAVTGTGHCFEEIGRLCGEQAKLDWNYLCDMMTIYKGMLSGWPSVLKSHSEIIGKNNEIEVWLQDGKLNDSEAVERRTRASNSSYALLAEINCFHKHRVSDMKSSHQHFLREQIKFYQKIVAELKKSLSLYELSPGADNGGSMALKTTARPAGSTTSPRSLRPAVTTGTAGSMGPTITVSDSNLESHLVNPSAPRLSITEIEHPSVINSPSLD